jgi:hypothetical protein
MNFLTAEKNMREEKKRKEFVLTIITEKLNLEWFFQVSKT